MRPTLSHLREVIRADFGKPRAPRAATVARRQRRVLDDNPAPNCNFLGARQAFNLGFQIFALPPNATAHQWAEFQAALARHAIVVDVRVERHGRRWSLGVPPPGFLESRLRELAAQAGMLGDTPITFRWVPIRGPKNAAPIRWVWNSPLRDC